MDWNIRKWLGGSPSHAGLTAIGITPEGACIARVERDGDKPSLRLCTRRTWRLGEESDALNQISRQYGFGKARCTTLLAPGDYSLVLTDAPEVKPEELRRAIRWRVKDLIPFSINDATVDAFELPASQVGGRARQVYAVAALNGAIQARAALFDQSGITLDVIDIPEMACRNLAALAPDNARGVGLLCFGERSGLMTLTRESSLMLSREFTVGRAALTQPEGRDRVVLEVQRTLDYYESQFRMSAIGTLYLDPASARDTALLDYLRSNLGVRVEPYPLEQFMTTPADLPAETLDAAFLTIGAALRDEG